MSGPFKQNTKFKNLPSSRFRILIQGSGVFGGDWVSNQWKGYGFDARNSSDAFASADTPPIGLGEIVCNDSLHLAFNLALFFPIKFKRALIDLPFISNAIMDIYECVAN